MGFGNIFFALYLCYFGRGLWIFWVVYSFSLFVEFYFDVYVCCFLSFLRDDRWCLLVICKKNKIIVIIKNLLKKWILFKFLWYDLICGWNFFLNFCYFEIWVLYNVSKYELNEIELWYFCFNIYVNKRINRF